MIAMISGFGVASVSSALSARTKPYPDLESKFEVALSLLVGCISLAVLCITSRISAGALFPISLTHTVPSLWVGLITGFTVPG